MCILKESRVSVKNKLQYNTDSNTVVFAIEISCVSIALEDFKKQ